MYAMIITVINQATGKHNPLARSSICTCGPIRLVPGTKRGDYLKTDYNLSSLLN